MIMSVKDNPRPRWVGIPHFDSIKKTKELLEGWEKSAPVMTGSHPATGKITMESIKKGKALIEAAWAEPWHTQTPLEFFDETFPNATPEEREQFINKCNGN